MAKEQSDNLTQTKINAKVSEVLEAPTPKAVTIADGDGLYLKITPEKRSDGGRPTSAATSWLFRYQLAGKRRWMGLGSYPKVREGAARKEVKRLRGLTSNGIDPLTDKQAALEATAAQAREAEREAMTFKTCAEQYMDAKETQWRNPKHRQQWRNTLKAYAYPVIGDKSVARVETADVLAILQPIWTEKTETAKRVQGRIENILDYAKSMGWREGENPARWKGHLSHTLPTPSKIAKVEHSRAIPHKEAPALVAALQKSDTSAARALLLTMYCATRTSETLKAKWQEIDLEARLWTIPGDRMKAGKDHRIPLTDAAVAILERQKALRINDWIFPGQRLGKPLSNMAMISILKRLKWYDRTTVHGLRSTFRDWVAETTNYPDRLAEAALAHQLSDKVQAAYNRSDLMEKRREMMEAWTRFLTKKPGKVVELPTARNTG
jgi:integrase